MGWKNDRGLGFAMGTFSTWSLEPIRGGIGVKAGQYVAVGALQEFEPHARHSPNGRQRRTNVPQETF